MILEGKDIFNTYNQKKQGKKEPATASKAGSFNCGVWSYIFGIECLFLAFVQVFCSKATFIIMGQKANVNKKVDVLFTTILQRWKGVMSTKNIKKVGKILHKNIGKNRAIRT